jgi:HAMP domain-containing protein
LQELGKDQSLEMVNRFLGQDLTTDEIGRLRVSVDRLVEYLLKHTPT